MQVILFLYGQYNYTGKWNIILDKKLPFNIYAYTLIFLLAAVGHSAVTNLNPQYCYK